MENPSTPGPLALDNGSRHSGARRGLFTPYTTPRRDPVTPHTIRAMRKLNTPRRRVSRYRVPTPRDDLRALSRALVREKKELEHQKTIEYTSPTIVVETAGSQPAPTGGVGEAEEEPLVSEDLEGLTRGSEIAGSSSREAIEQVETRRRMTNSRLSLAPRLSEEFSFAHDHTVMRMEGRKESLAFPNESILEEEVPVEPTFRIEFHEEEDVVPEPDFHDELINETTNYEINDNFDVDEQNLMDMNNDDDNVNGKDYQWSDLDNDYDGAKEDNATLPMQIPTATVAQARQARRPTREQPTALPTRIIKSFIKSLPLEKRLAPSVMPAIIEASEAYFEQAMADLADYSEHARRTRIDGSDVVQLMRRQRIISRNMPLYAVAKQHLPGELMDLI
ncbi:hypothetical protein TRVA0_013S00606 [Trichomonascus vanleenenianus]|uniref:CENP-T family protein n=1 Tax=Trichomonascus vanleenenianus TaxID=2268995 RepID=UPI003ECA3173